MKAIILAAGLGKRLGLKDVPKPMYRVDGKPILEHNILLLKEHNIKDICINLHHLPDVIKNYFGDGNKWGVKVQYSYEKELLGTGGAVKNVEWFLDKSPFFVVYGDNYSNIDLTEMLDFHTSSKATATIAVFNPKETVSSDIAGGFITMDKDCRLLSFKEGKCHEAEGIVNAGVYILEPEVLSIIPGNSFSDFGNDIFPKLLIKSMAIRGYLVKGFVLAIDTKEALEKASSFLKVGGFRNDNN